MKKDSPLHKLLATKDFDYIKGEVTKHPHNIIVTEDGDLCLLKYSQIDSQMGHPLVNQCRGIIFSKRTYEIVCWPFDKFYNYGEFYAAPIEWESARVLEKVDGSIIKVWHCGKQWRVSTNGCIDAHKAETPAGKTFGELFLHAAEKQSLPWDHMRFDYTYVFELVSPFNKNVISYPNTKIYHLGTRDNISGHEKEVDLGIEKPKHYSFASINDAVNAAFKLPFSEEGYVVVDGNYNRIKVKSPAYVAAHHLRNNGVITPKRFLGIVLENEVDEFITYFPEFDEPIREAKEKLNAYIGRVQEDYARICSLRRVIHDRKSYAGIAKNTTNPSLMFKVFERFMEDPSSVSNEELADMVKHIPTDKLAQMIGFATSIKENGD